MKILQRYVLGSFLSSFFLAFLVLTFVLSVGLLVKATQLVVHDVPMAMVARYLLIGVPESFSFTIPLAALVSSLLVFGRLSSDGEIGAMKACGVNLWQIMVYPILVGIVLSVFGVYINNEITPANHEMRREMQNDMGVDTGIRLLEPGRTIRDFGGMGVDIWFETIEEVNGTNWLGNISIYDKTKNGTPRTTHADRACVIEKGEDMVLDMFNVRIDPFDENYPGAATAGRFSHVVEGVMKKRTYQRKIEDYRLRELYDWVGKFRYDVRVTGENLRRAEQGLVSAEEEFHEAEEALRIAGEALVAAGGQLPSADEESAPNDASTDDVPADEEAAPDDASADDASAEPVPALSGLPEARDGDVVPAVAGTEGEAAGDAGAEEMDPALAAATEAFQAARDRMVSRRKAFHRAGEKVEANQEQLKERRKSLRTIRFEFHRRYAMASAAICFLMLGMPLGIRARRRESTIGVAISLVVALLFYLLVVSGEQFVKHISTGPVHLIVWVPAVVCLVLSAWLTLRNS